MKNRALQSYYRFKLLEGFDQAAEEYSDSFQDFADESILDWRQMGEYVLNFLESKRDDPEFPRIPFETKDKSPILVFDSGRNSWAEKRDDYIRDDRAVWSEVFDFKGEGLNLERFPPFGELNNYPRVNFRLDYIAIWPEWCIADESKGGLDRLRIAFQYEFDNQPRCSEYNFMAEGVYSEEEKFEILKRAYHLILKIKAKD